MVQSQERFFFFVLVQPPGLGGGGGGWEIRNVPRLCIVYPGICLTTEENHGKPQSGYPKGAWLICAERDSFSRLGHRGRWPRMACWPLPPLAFATGDGVNPRSA
jgi:hypothetical protein